MQTLRLSISKPIPNKIYFKISEVSKICNVEPYVLRFWESEFKMHPSKSKSNQRLYQRKDVDQMLMIKNLLYQERFTIEGAKKKLKELKKEQRANQLKLFYENENKEQQRINIREKVLSIKAILKEVQRELSSMNNFC